MLNIYLSWLGFLLAHLCRLIGTPLALYSGVNVPMEVRVYPDQNQGGMVWDRFYRYPDGRLNRVKSTKCIRADAGLIELVGCGFGMYLSVSEIDRAIVFECTRYFWQVGRFRISIPQLLTPGKTIVKQRALRNKKFEFSLDVHHRLLGKVFYQVGVFKAV